MPGLKEIAKPAAWAFYVVFVFEILFMISPFALYFYSAYGPTLNFLHRWPATAWLTQFFLPHFSETRSPLLNALAGLTWPLILVGLSLFLAGAIPIYLAKLRRRGAVTGGLYRVIRHPQYVGLAIAGLGTVLLWPRFLALVTFITMLLLYALLARWEEEQCLARFGESYRAYQARTGMFLPRSLSGRILTFLPASGRWGKLAALGISAVLVAGAVALGFGLRNYSLANVSSFYADDVAVLSPALLTDQELHAAYRLAESDAGVRERLRDAGPAKLIVYVVPEDWYLPDLPIEAAGKFGEHHVPADFDRRRYKLLFTRARTHAAEATGREIVKAAYGRDPLVLVKVDVSSAEITGIETPPPHVMWGDIPTPMF